MLRTYMEDTEFSDLLTQKSWLISLCTQNIENLGTLPEIRHATKKKKNISAVYVWSNELNEGLVARNNSIPLHLALLCG